LGTIIQYLKDHFVSLKQKRFQIEFLNRIIFYINESREFDSYYKYFQTKGYELYNHEIKKVALSQGVLNLKGWWIGLNRNLEKGNIALCRYIFEERNERMVVRREAYITETIYKGYVHVQEDSEFVFDLEGETQHRKKFIMAHAEKVIPNSIKCISSGFEVSTGKPILIKEILFKIPDNDYGELGRGKTIPNGELNYELQKYFTQEEVKIVRKQIDAYLDESMVPYLSQDDFVILKKDILELSKKSKTEINHLTSMFVYFHFNRLKEENKHMREIVKYYKKKGQNNEFAHKEVIDVIDEYTKIKISQYPVKKYYTHKVYYETEAPVTAVDIQSLFPITKTDTDNDLKHPFLRISNRIMDADTDIFVSSATVINDFGLTGRLAVHFDKKTQKTEIVIDFTSVQHQLNDNFQIDEFSFNFNEPDGEGTKELHFKPTINGGKGFNFDLLDKKKSEWKIIQTDSIDIENPRIFSIIINFEVNENDILYISFKI